MKQVLFGLTLIGLSVFLPRVQAENLPTSDLVPGGIAVFDVGPAEQPAPEVRFGRQRVMVVADGRRWKALIGLPLDLLPGEYIFLLKPDQATEFGSHTFAVGNTPFSSERITTPRNEQEDPAPNPVKALRRDRKEINRVFRHWTSKLDDALPLTLPASGKIDDHFGKRRYLNSKQQAPYAGVDIVVPPGTPLYAPANGVVGAIGHYSSDGNSLLIEHGEGLVSMLSRLRDTSVKKGESVTRGQIIGKSGENGATSVEWKVSLNDARVNPLRLLGKQEPEQTTKKADDKGPKSKGYQ